jgi:hypothetical protein
MSRMKIYTGRWGESAYTSFIVVCFLALILILAGVARGQAAGPSLGNDSKEDLADIGASALALTR